MHGASGVPAVLLAFQNMFADQINAAN